MDQDLRPDLSLQAAGFDERETHNSLITGFAVPNPDDSLDELKISGKLPKVQPADAVIGLVCTSYRIGSRSVRNFILSLLLLCIHSS